MQDYIGEVEERKLITRRSFSSKWDKGKFWLKGRARKRKDRREVLTCSRLVTQDPPHLTSPTHQKPIFVNVQLVPQNNVLGNYLNCIWEISLCQVTLKWCINNNVITLLAPFVSISANFWWFLRDCCRVKDFLYLFWRSLTILQHFGQLESDEIPLKLLRAFSFPVASPTYLESNINSNDNFKNDKSCLLSWFQIYIKISKKDSKPWHRYLKINFPKFRSGHDHIQLNIKTRNIWKNPVLHCEWFQILEKLSLSQSSLWIFEMLFVTSIHRQQHYLGSLQYYNPWRHTMRMLEKVPDMFCITYWYYVPLAQYFPSRVTSSILMHSFYK